MTKIFLKGLKGLATPKENFGGSEKVLEATKIFKFKRVMKGHGDLEILTGLRRTTLFG